MRIVLLLLVLAVRPALAQEVRFELYARMDGQVLLEDGHVTNAWGFGWAGQPMTVPAPTLIMTTGDSVAVAMRNVSTEAHTIHLHGLDVDQVNDGVPHTSFYVYNGDSATYRFRAAYPGTYIYHCHVTTTMHLTMGMYGLLVVRHPGNVLFDGGPAYVHERLFLSSDLEVRVNDDPLMAFPFHEIRPDRFLLNGLSGAQILADTTMHVDARVGEPVLFRVANIAYSVVRYVFPPGTNATVHMSDGRPLPTAFTTDTLELYPGERFSVLLEPTSAMEDTIFVEHYSMINGELVGVNALPMRIKALPGLPTGTWTVAPNPAVAEVLIMAGGGGEVVSWYASDGRFVREDRLQPGENRIALPNVAPGLYFLRDTKGVVQELIVGGR